MMPQLVPLIEAETIQRRVQELGAQITQDYQDTPPLALCVLKGAWMFFADLVRHIRVPLRCEFLSASSYGADTISQGKVSLHGPQPDLGEHEHILLVEDIIDTGLTLNTLCQWLKDRGAGHVRVCTLLDKPERRAVPVTLDYVGFSIPNQFVVGYGLDYDQQYRNLPYIAMLQPDK